MHLKCFKSSEMLMHITANSIGASNMTLEGRGIILYYWNSHYQLSCNVFQDIYEVQEITSRMLPPPYRKSKTNGAPPQIRKKTCLPPPKSIKNMSTPSKSPKKSTPIKRVPPPLYWWMVLHLNKCKRNCDLKNMEKMQI